MAARPTRSACGAAPVVHPELAVNIGADPAASTNGPLLRLFAVLLNVAETALATGGRDEGRASGTDGTMTEDHDNATHLAAAAGFGTEDVG